LESALDARAESFDARRETAFRLFNGFVEGCPELAIDLYARTLVLHNYADPPHDAQPRLAEAQAVLLARLPWVRAVVVKPHKAARPVARRGEIVYGEEIDRRVDEGGVWYAIDLLMHQDASLYLDTRNVRRWARQRLSGKRVLNTFAYTGSLGVAAMAGGARRVVHLDRKRAFLNVAKTSYTLNGFPIDKADFRTGDFFTQASRLKRAGERFDCVFVDPPYFSATGQGRVDLARDSRQIVNKVRPLIAHGGLLVAINNALFVSGAEYMATLEALCADGYLSFEERIDVPLDFTGYPVTRAGSPPADPAPFNHSTKIAVLRVRRKDAKDAERIDSESL
jgi:23S rRNA (cytosine1962-C5)-methyltransferase